MGGTARAMARVSLPARGMGLLDLPAGDNVAWSGVLGGVRTTSDFGLFRENAAHGLCPFRPKCLKKPAYAEGLQPLPPPPKSAKKSQQIGRPNRWTDFSAKRVPSALYLSPRPQTHLPLGCSVVGVMWKAKICLNFKKIFSSPGLYMVLKE